MTLDILKIGRQVSRMGGTLARRYAQLPERAERAREVLAEHAGCWEWLATDVAASAKRRLAQPLEPLDVRYPALPAPRDYLVIATDGSQIEPDRHGAADYYVINVGWAVLIYGRAPAAELDSEPILYFDHDELYIVHGERRVPVQDRLLGAKRAGREMAKAAQLAAAWQELDLPTVVLADGTLLLWVLDDRPDDFLRQELLEPYVDEMVKIRDLGLPLASYISRPRSTEVSGLLREAACRGGVAACPPCAAREDGVCALERLPDRELFRDLAVGERSARFRMTLPKDLEEFYGEHVPHFFYLNVGSEIARVEVPPWVGEDPDHLALVQAAILDQCGKGLGYPNVLTRAHEQAVVRVRDRLAFEHLLELVMAREGVPARLSEKLFSKRVQAV
ncbi:MAG: DNA double-strand break repair nuclease NurA [Chloroflexi bacterium]|nr:DNA double-strand break repair nuclease NurA [Chloroflexota bacterium]